MVTIYHNSRCTKSRETLKLLQDRGIQAHIVEYLKTPPSQDEIRHLLKLLGIDARALVRTKEPEYQRAALDGASETELVRAMAQHPVLIERPIVVAGDKAALGRPPENVLKIL
jgi:arsenate reductase